MRKPKWKYYLDIAQSVAERGTCLRRNYGAIIVKNDEIISTGYTGTPRSVPNCCDLGVCEREKLKIPSGERYELCKSVHAEMNAIICASRQEMLGSILYLSGTDAKTQQFIDCKPCSMCWRLIQNAGIEKVIGRTADGGYHEIDVRADTLLEALDLKGEE